MVTPREMNGAAKHMIAASTSPGRPPMVTAPRPLAPNTQRWWHNESRPSSTRWQQITVVLPVWETRVSDSSAVQVRWRGYSGVDRDDDAGEPTAVWCWRKGVHRERWRIDRRTGRVVGVRQVATDPLVRVAMAGWVKRCAAVPVAVYTPDGENLVVQRRRRRVILTDESLTAMVRTCGPFSVLTLRSPKQRTARIRDWAWAERFIDPMDDRFLDMIHRLASSPEVALERWDPWGTPDPSV